MKKIITLMLLFCIVSMSYAQKRNCHTNEHLEQLKKQDPNLELRMQQIESFTQERIKQMRKNQNYRIDGEVITIPVVVHVVYNQSNTIENISDAQIQSQIDVINEDFRRTNADANDVWSQAADTQIQFCLANVDPQGNATNGITRKASSRSSWGTGDAIKSAAQGGVDAWDPSQYLNMWVGNIGGGILGYAQFPGGPAATDGVVMSPQYFGSSAKGTGFYLSAPYDLGRTTTHEIGHYLNLRHIWGDGGCGVDDFVADTPESDAPNYGCATNHVSCGSVDMVQNYMDYSEDACMNLYTQGQKDRMRAILAEGGVRRSLALSNKCDGGSSEPTCNDGIQNGDETGIDCGGSNCEPCQAEPTCNDGIQNGDETGVDCGGSNCEPCQAEPTCNDGIQNGDETGVDCGGSNCEPCQAEPTCNDGIQNGDETGVDCGGSNCEPCQAEPTCNDGIQNGDETGVDCGGSNCEPCQTGEGQILLQSYFETGWDGWIDGGSDAYRYRGRRSYEGRYSIRLRDNSGVASSMTSQDLNLTGFNEVQLEFYFYAYSMENSEDFWIRFNDGSSWNTVAAFAQGADFSNNTYYVATVTMSAADLTFGTNNAIRIQNDASTNGDQIYIDQVTITGVTNSANARGTGNSIRAISSGNERSIDFEGDFMIYPNPVKGSTLTIKSIYEGDAKYRIINMLGQTITKGTLNATNEINVSNLRTGMYFIEVNDGEELTTKKFVKE